MVETKMKREGKERHDEPVVREGRPIIAFFFVLMIATWFVGWTLVSTLLFLMAGFCVWFFRNPERTITGGDNIVSSPADGKVIGIEKEVTHELLPGPRTKVSIFMNLFNVHVNRMPCGGRVERVKYYPGRFFSANLDKASQENERNAVLVKRWDGKEVLTVQIAGLIARRIACWVKEGMEVKRGERFGLIRFGSRLEVFLPPEAEVRVKPGDRVKAGETPLGELS
ncbi:MAG TPA: phosphatidylserine decarboxylase family protein [Syntrophales bacterium]|nr:phosphatidylserine decarboxylase family protein [Syntrophales bacterium]HOL59087.1 phosphatidylserine decarboxylase family protein [Syntrophales bacterium]HPO35404.1 phosphatidylserine decarboxylase family protein [Syntrophales bacterium]